MMKSVTLVALACFCIALGCSDKCEDIEVMLEKLGKWEITHEQYIEYHRRCHPQASPYGYQPSCSSADEVTQAVAKIDNKGSIEGASGENIEFHIKGVVSFQELSKTQTKIYAIFTGVKAFYDDSDQFSLHVHQKGETNPSCSATGGHFNPCGKDHSNDPRAENRHVGDVAKVTLDKGSDILIIETIDPQVKLNGPLSVLGRSVTVHAGAKSSRVGCSTIAVTEWEGGDRHPDTNYNGATPTDFWKH